MQETESSSVVPKIKLKANVSFRWSEKVWILVDFLQLYGLLWVIAQPWAWPHLWTAWTNWTVWANLDYFSFTEDGALRGKTGSVGISRWGQMTGYAYYALAFSLLPVVFTTAGLLIKHFFKKYSSVALASLLFLLQLLYLPVLLAVFRLYYCDHGYLSADPTLSCSSQEYTLYTSLATIFVFPLAVGLPYVIYIHVADLVVYRHKYDHEKMIQVWELSHSLGLNNFWVLGQVWLTSSFKRNGSYFRVWILMFKLALLLVFIFLRNSLVKQAAAYFIVSLVFCLPVIKMRPFRLPTTNAILILCAFMYLVATGAGMCNAFEVQNAMLVASRESFFLLSLFSFGALGVLISVMISVFYLRDDWPSILTIDRINSSSNFLLVSKWIAAMTEADAVCANYFESAPEVNDLSELNRMLIIVRKCWLVARNNGSIFEIMLGDMLDHLLLYYNRLSSKSLLNERPYLRDSLRSAGPSLAFRDNKTILMPRRKLRLLTKMTAVRAFLGNRMFAESIRNAESASGKLDDDWGLDIDRVKDLLKKLPDNIQLTESVLQNRNRSDWQFDMDYLLNLYGFWEDVVLKLEASQIRDEDLGGNVQAEDCYTYRRLLHDYVMAVRNNAYGNGYNDEELSGASGDDYNVVAVHEDAAGAFLL